MKKLIIPATFFLIIQNNCLLGAHHETHRQMAYDEAFIGNWKSLFELIDKKKLDVNDDFLPQRPSTIRILPPLYAAVFHRDPKAVRGFIEREAKPYGYILKEVAYQCMSNDYFEAMSLIELFLKNGATIHSSRHRDPCSEQKEETVIEWVNKADKDNIHKFDPTEKEKLLDLFQQYVDR